MSFVFFVVKPKMKFAGLLKPLTSFRMQLIAFIALMLLAMAITLGLINQRLEVRTTGVVDEYIRAITLANDVLYQSVSGSKYLFQLVNLGEAGSLAVNNESVIRHILVVDEARKIVNSTDSKDLGQQLSPEISALPPLQKGDIKDDVHIGSSDQQRTMSYSFDTDKGKRTVYFVISMNRLQRVKETAERDRLIAASLLGVLLLVVTALFSNRLTRPISDLAEGARRVTAGDVEFQVPVKGPEEVSALSVTFNEMLVGLRRNQELEEELQRSERSAVVGRLASGIAHEIRNPLNFINLSIDHLREAFAPANPAQSAQYKHILTTIKDELARLNQLVSDFLSYGRPAKLKLRDIDARVLAEEVRDLVAAKADEQGVKIAIESNGADTRLTADAEQLKTCFSNLMINAVQAMPGGGDLDVVLNTNDGHIEIEFSDTGTGMLPETLEQIFEPYYSTKETGIGLGLPLTKKIIEEHGGQIEVESEVGIGTSFIVTLPRKNV